MNVEVEPQESQEKPNLGDLKVNRKGRRAAAALKRHGVKPERGAALTLAAHYGHRNTWRP